MAPSYSRTRSGHVEGTRQGAMGSKVLAFWAALSLSILTGAAGGPLKTTDNYTPQCGTLLPDPPPGGWLLWSQPATWGGGQVPGTGANVTIPCNTGVLLDVPFVQLTLLEVQGALKVKDSPSLPLVNITAAFIVVKGRFIIGNSTNQFKQKVEIRLMPNPNNRASYSFTSPLPAEPAFPRGIGHKAFAVVGGQVDFHGLPGSPNMLTWTRLATTATAGSSSVTVKGNVADWPVGFPVVIAPSDYYPDQEDVRSITAVSCTASSCTLTLDKSLTYNHFSGNISDGFGGTIEEAAEVALLTRNIVIMGTDEPGAYALEGGHFIVYMTQTQQFIEGVEFLLMGQQGRLGRYNIHMHVCKDQNNSVIRKNLILHSKQRCVVIHATFNTVVDGNVAYNTSGHCFMIEEGGETGNTFSNNLGLRTRAVTQLIAADETDNKPATFWITNPNNSYIGNAAGGSDDSGFWLELRTAVRGMSLSWARVNQTVPVAVSTLGQYLGNSAHSNLFAGFRMYPHGLQPRLNATVSNRSGSGPIWVELGNFNLWKNNQVGVFIHGTYYVSFANSTLADNTRGIEVFQAQGVNVTGHRIVGLSNNYGNPTNCQSPGGAKTCQPVTGCAFPLPAGAMGRSCPYGTGNHTIFGVTLTEIRQLEGGIYSNVVTNTSFSAFDNACHPAAAVGISGDRADFWNAGDAVRSLRFSGVTKTIKAFLFPRDFTEASGSPIYHAGEPATMFALRDLDGSIVGSPGYIVANNTAILPPPSVTPKCTLQKDFNAYLCPGTCYRTVQVMYDEPGFTLYPAPTASGNNPDGPRVLGDFSYLIVTRLNDSSTLTLIGNLHQYMATPDEDGSPYNESTRTFPMSLLAGFTYEVTFVPATNNPNFVPSQLTIQYKDGSGCGQGLTIRIKGSAQKQYSWAVQPSDLVMWSPCPGNEAALGPAVLPVPFSYACSTSTAPAAQALQLSLTPALPAMAPVVLLLVPIAPPGCTASTRCGLTTTNSVWLYNESYDDLHAAYNGGPAFYNPLYPTPAPDWSVGPGALGYDGWASPAIRTFLSPTDFPRLQTYYFKTSFSVKRSSCYSSLLLDLVVLDGVVLYLNNVEVLRANMPAGPVTNKTQALSHTTAGPNANRSTYGYTSFNVSLTAPGVAFSLVEGANYFAAEVHHNMSGIRQVGFALRASVVLDTSCNAPKKTAEVCDGVDNDADGKVDVNPASGKVLQRTCWTVCGTGLETCINGAYQNCTAEASSVETCNGKDDNCDGLVDNGIGQLDCPAGNVCFTGKCQPVQPLTASQLVWGPNSTGWYYNDKGNNLTGAPQWKKGALPGGNWSAGQANFGVFPHNTSWTFKTSLVPNTGNIWTRYFIKNFSIPDTATYGFSFGLQRVDGAVVYLNGQELFRSNMPNGTISFTTLAVQYAAFQDPKYGPFYALTYNPYSPLRAYGLPAIKGSNTIAVELHGSSQYIKDWVFDLNLTRHVVQPCQGAGSCVRRPPVDTTIVFSKETWKFLDASKPLPAGAWYTTSFDDSAWPAGPAPIGSGPGVGTTMTLGSVAGNGRITYYYRKTVTIPDGACFYNLTANVLSVDGSVFYINGAEAARVNMPSGNIIASTPASTGNPSWKFSSFVLSSGWLLSGVNVFAVEVHQAPGTNPNYRMDFNLTGQREGASCTPLPP